MTLDEYIALRKLLRGNGFDERLRHQDEQLSAIRKQTDKIGWWQDFSSNVAGNAAWDAARWLFRAIAQRL